MTPPAVDASEFEPSPNQPWPANSDSPITIVALSRLVYRKGIDIMALVIPEVCHRYPNVNFVIGECGHCHSAWGLAPQQNPDSIVANDTTPRLLLQDLSTAILKLSCFKLEHSSNLCTIMTGLGLLGRGLCPTLQEGL